MEHCSHKMKNSNNGSECTYTSIIFHYMWIYVYSYYLKLKNTFFNYLKYLNLEK